MKSINICCHMGYGTYDYFKYAYNLLRSMYHLATSKVCILDSYWPAVSMLKHKKQLTVIQLWHSISKLKKSGHQTLGKVSGRKNEYAKALNMHDNYDYVVTGAEIWNPYYCEAFGIKDEQILNFGLPRIDHLIKTEEKNCERFFKEYPQCKDKTIILYAPTFRKNMKSSWKDILKVTNDDKYVFLIKRHPSQRDKNKMKTKNVFYLDEWETIDLIAVCDYMITDYSSVAFEAAVLSKKVYYWTYDYEQYIENNGLNMDMKTELAPFMFSDISELMDDIKNDNYDLENYKGFQKKYLPEKKGESTKQIVDFILERCEERKER